MSNVLVTGTNSPSLSKSGWIRRQVARLHDGRTGTVPLIIAGMGLNGLGIARSIGKAAPWVPIYGFHGVDDLAGRYSRYASHRYFKNMKVEDLVDEILSFAESLNVRPALIVTQENIANELASRLEDVSSRVHICFPEGQLYNMLMNKGRFQSVAESAGLSIPSGVIVGTSEEIEAARFLAAPFALKPVQRNRAYECEFKKAYKVQTFDELSSLAARILRVVDEVVIQEWVEGADDAIYFCLQYRSAANVTLASFTGRKIRSWPPRVGGTASCTAAPDADAELRKETDRFFEALGVAGFVSMEYKRDARTGRYMAIEPTVGRTDHQEEVATLNGVNIPLVGYCDLAGLPLPASRAVEAHPVIWRDSVADRLASRANGSAKMPRGQVVDAVFRYDDPGPALAWLLGPHRLPFVGRK